MLVCISVFGEHEGVELPRGMRPAATGCRMSLRDEDPEWTVDRGGRRFMRDRAGAGKS